MLIIKTHENKKDVYDITVENSNFYANGILVHNCQEISLPTKPIEHLDDTDGEIATCILSAINLGKIKKLSDLEEICELTVRALDALIEEQDYPVKAAEVATKARRSLGVGVINYAYYLAKNKAKLGTQEARQLTHELFEAIQYYLLKASNKLAKEIGVCQKYHETKYANGIFPIDTYKKEIDEFANFSYLQDWDSLRENVRLYGLRNSTLTALMPSESSSVISGATSGIDFPRDFLTAKQSGSGVMKMIVPEYDKLKKHYTLLPEIKDMTESFKLLAIMQKFIDQSISTNTNYWNNNYEDDKVPMDVLIGDMFLAYKYGLKTLYYDNTLTYSTESDTVEESGCASGACAI